MISQKKGPSISRFPVNTAIIIVFASFEASRTVISSGRG
jgi:hypothetical protein